MKVRGQSFVIKKTQSKDYTLPLLIVFSICAFFSFMTFFIVVLAMLKG